MTPTERGHLFPIIHEPSNPAWRVFYREEKARIIQAIGKEYFERMNHIGSTSVPNLLAKPTIDILLEIKGQTDLQNFISKLLEIGYLYEPKPTNPAPGMMFMKGYTLEGFRGQAVHLHVRYLGDWDELYFRDYLKKHPETAQAYASLKEELREKYTFDREAYTDGKTAFCKEITRLARNEFKTRYAISKTRLYPRLVAAENAYPGLFSQAFEKPWGVLFMNPENPISHDSNHAVITRGKNYRKILSEITTSFEEHKITPRIYGCYRKHQLETMEPLLTRLGFSISKNTDTLMIHVPGLNATYPHRLTFKRQTTYDEALFKHLFEPESWVYDLPVQKVSVASPSFHVLVGYWNDVAVVTATITDFSNAIYRIDDVETAPGYRKQGFAREMMSFVVSYFEENIRGLLYLWVSDASAKKIYQEVGFVESDLLQGRWSAYKK